MQSETLSLTEKLSDASASEAVRVLNGIPGVRKAAVASEAAIAVDYDEELTSLQEVRTVLRKAGFSIRVPQHGEEGMCCGSCGGM